MDPLDLMDPVELMDPMDPMDLIELVDLIDLIDPVHRLEFLELIDLLVFVAFYFSELSIEVALIFFSLKWEQNDWLFNSEFVDTLILFWTLEH